MKLSAPPLGFNTWNTFGEDISDELICRTADRIVELGLLDAGYNYVVIDDCWSEKQRDENGRLVPNREKFPRGIKAVADYVHEKGLKFGIYSCVGNRTCADYPGSFEHEFIDAETFAEWGVDYLKYDYCFKPMTEKGDLLYKRMALALANCGRDIVFSACNWGAENSKEWIKETGAHLWRSGNDIRDNWKSISDIFALQTEMIPYCSPSCYNDMDMLVIGMNGEGFCALGGCSEAEYQTHFAMWCMFASPLMIGCDIRKIDESALRILKNRDLIDICCDPLCCQPYMIDGIGCSDSHAQVWVRNLENGDIAIAMFNLGDGPSKGFLPLVSVGLNASTGRTLTLHELYTGEVIENVRGEYLSEPIPAHGCKIFRAKVKKA